MQRDDGDAQRTEGHRGCVCDERQACRFDGPETEADEQCTTDGNGRAEAGSAFEECAEGKGYEQQLQTAVVGDLSECFFERFKAPGLYRQLVKKDDRKNDPADGEDSVACAVSGCGQCHADGHVKYRNGRDQRSQQAERRRQMRCHTEDRHGAQQQDNGKRGNGRREPPVAGGVVDLRPLAHGWVGLEQIECGRDNGQHHRRIHRQRFRRHWFLFRRAFTLFRYRYIRLHKSSRFSDGPFYTAGECSWNLYPSRCILADKMSLRQQRPIGVTLIALGFLWIGIGGALFFPLLILAGAGQDLWRHMLEPVIHSGSASKIVSRAIDITLYVIYVAYAVIGFGLWKLKNWARKSVLGVAVICLLGAVVVAFALVKPISLSIFVIGMAVLECGWIGWYLLRPRVLDAFGAWNRYTPDFEWIQPPILSKRGRLGMSAFFAAVFLVMCLLPLSIAVNSSMENSGAYKLTMSTAEASPCVFEALGLPLKTGWMLSGEVTESSTKGSANLSIPVQGPKGKGALDSRADKVNGRWRIKSLVFKYGSGRSTIVPSRSNGGCR